MRFQTRAAPPLSTCGGSVEEKRPAGTAASSGGRPSRQRVYVTTAFSILPRNAAESLMLPGSINQDQRRFPLGLVEPSTERPSTIVVSMMATGPGPLGDASSAVS